MLFCQNSLAILAQAILAQAILAQARLLKLKLLEKVGKCERGLRADFRGMVVLTPVLAAGLRWLVEAAGRAVPAAAQLPTGCREAAMHALLTCAVGPPRYVTPGWGPCSHCWGWLCVGLLLGVLGTGLLWLRVATHRRPPPAWSVAASETLRCMAVGGETELQALAEAAGQTPTELLCSILRQATATHAPQMPALLSSTNRPQPTSGAAAMATSARRRRPAPPLPRAM